MRRLNLQPRILDASLIPDPEDNTRYLSVLDALIQEVAAGQTRECAARLAGVSPASVTGWVNRGLDAITECCQKNSDPTGTPDEPYINLALHLDYSEGTAEAEAVRAWRKGFRKDWRSAQKWLETTNPTVWAAPTRTEHSGPDGGPIQIRPLTHDAAARKIVELEQRRAGQAS